MIKTLREDLSKILKSKTIGEMLGNITYSHIEIISFAAIILFLFSPVYQVFANIFSNIFIGCESVYYENIKVDNQFATIIGGMGLVLFVGKKFSEGSRLRDFVDFSHPMFYFAVFIVLMMISTCLNGFTDYAIRGEGYRHESIFSYMRYFCIYFLCTSVIDSRKIKSLAEYIFVFGSIVVGIAAIIHIRVMPLDYVVHYTVRLNDFNFTFGNSNHFGYYLAMVVVLSGSLFVYEESRVLKILNMASVIINTYVLIMNNTFGAYLGCLFGLIFTIIVSRICGGKVNSLAVVVLIVFLVVTVIFPEKVIRNMLSLFMDVSKIFGDNPADDAGTGRWQLWTLTVGYMTEKPLFGFGTEGIYERLLNDTIDTVAIGRVHNEFLQYAAFYGIPAGIMYICGVMAVFLRGLKNRSELDCYTISALSASFAYLVSSFFGNSFYYTAPFLFIFLGFGLAGKGKKRVHS